MSDTHHKKPNYKPPKWFKTLKRRLERARLNRAMREGKDIPVVKKNDIWEWN